MEQVFYNRNLYTGMQSKFSIHALYCSHGRRHQKSILLKNCLQMHQRQQLISMKSLLKEIGIILMVVIPLALVTNSLRPSGLRLIDTGIPIMQPVEANNPIYAIPLDKAIEKYKRGETLFIDARSYEDYIAGHIKGALNLPDHQFDEWIDDFLSRTDTDIEIITYCDGEDCFLGHDVAEKLYQSGFERVSCLVNGWTEWQESASPVVSQKIPGS